MNAPQECVSAILILVSLLSAGCDPPPALGETPGPGPSPNVCDYDLARLMPEGWSYIGKTKLEGGSECVVFYHFDPPRDDQWKKVQPIGGMVYRTDLNRPLDVHSYPLSLPGGAPLGEHQASVYLADVLSGAKDLELVVQDTNEDNIVVQASIFEWQPSSKSEESAYRSRGGFVGEGGVKVELDRVIVLRRRLGTRSQLADRYIYVPRENKSYYPKQGDKPEDTTRLVDPLTVDLVSLDMPENVAAAEYPEKLVLAFYESLPLTDTNKLNGLVGPEPPTQWLTRNPAALGCLIDSQLGRVFVQDLDIRSAHGIPPHLENTSDVFTDTVTVTSLCRLNLGGKQADKKSVITWQIRWNREGDKNTGRWQLLHP